MYIQHIGLTRLGTDSGAADLVAPPFHRPLVSGRAGTRDTGTPGNQDTGTLGHQDTRTPEHRNTGAGGFAGGADGRNQPSGTLNGPSGTRNRPSTPKKI